MSTDSAGAVLFAMYISRQHVGSSRVLFEGVDHRPVSQSASRQWLCVTGRAGVVWGVY